MEWYWVVTTATLTAAIGFGVAAFLNRRSRASQERQDASPVRPLLEAHFRPAALDQITVSEQRFPYRVRADLQRTIDKLFVADTTVTHFCGVRKEHAFEGLNFAGLLVAGHSPAVSVPPEYEEVDVGDEHPVRCLKIGLWFLEQRGKRYAVLLSPAGRAYGEVTGIQFQVATGNDPDGNTAPFLIVAPHAGMELLNDSCWSLKITTSRISCTSRCGT